MAYVPMWFSYFEVVLIRLANRFNTRLNHFPAGFSTKNVIPAAIKIHAGNAIRNAAT